MFGKLFLPRVMYTFMRYECTLYQAFKNKESIAPTTFFYDVKTFAVISMFEVMNYKYNRISKIIKPIPE